MPTRNYGDLLQQGSSKLRALPEKDRLKPSRRSASVVIERPAKKRPRHDSYRAGPGLIIGKKGARISRSLRARKSQSAMTGERRKRQHRRDSQAGDRRPARCREHRAAAGAPRRFPPRHEARRSVGHAAGRLGHSRSICGGRLGGAEIARAEWYREGRVPLHTLRADIDYGEATAMTTYGTCGSRCGSSRAISWPTTRWPRTSAGGPCRAAAQVRAQK